MKKQEAINFGRKFGVQLNIVEQILMKKTGLNKTQFFLRDKINISKKDLEELEILFKKIAFGYPIEYALNNAEFYGLNFYVDSRCLIPRNDTEIMVEQAIKTITSLENASIIYIDVGTGSGAIPISIYKNSGNKIKKAFAVDISEDALEVANINIQNHNLENKIELLKSDLLSEISPLLAREGIKEWVITANLPYIKNEDYGNMDKEVILHEPEIALYGGKKTGFELYEKLIEQIINYKIKAVLFIEIGFDQKKVAIDYLENKKLKFEIFKDNNKIERCIKVIF